jgi:prevent-host-death family protein
MRRWQLQEAKARLSEVVKSAREEPQEISVRGEAVVVVLAKVEYDRLVAPKPSFVELMRSSPLVGVRLDIERDPSPARELEL